MSTISKLLTKVPRHLPLIAEGRVLSMKNGLISAQLPFATLGDLCTIQVRGRTTLQASVVSFSAGTTVLAPFGAVEGLYPGALVQCTGAPPRIEVGDHLLGQVIDPFGVPFNHKQREHPAGMFREILAPPPVPTERLPIHTQLKTGVRSIDSLCPIGYGQRVAVIAAAGTGKSTLLSMLARNADVDVVVIGLVGERGREVNDFLEESLGTEGLARSVVVVATSDETAMRRVVAPLTATAIAEYFREKGLRVLLLIDSLTRTARAIREVGLAAGEVPVRGGYTPSVYSELPRMLERAGTGRRGSITAFYTLLSGGQNDDDPLAEEVKSLLDGHLMLRQEMVQRGVRPALDPLHSISRLAGRLLDPHDLTARERIIYALQRLRRDRDLILMGGQGDDELRHLLEKEGSIYTFLTQHMHLKEDLERSKTLLHQTSSLLHHR